MLRQLNLLALPTAISIASFDATFFVAARVVGLSVRLKMISFDLKLLRAVA
jgi:hypothetical protein